MLLSDTRLAVRIADFGTDQVTPEYEEPDIDAKLEGKQSPRGWGLFLIKNMVDEINVTTDKTLHTVELILNLKGGS
jgi:anti-sigma regulatory factor (Ser/Thr protein kinase)